MKSFITGSYAYGTPTKKSDIDLVVLMDGDWMERIRGFADTCDTKKEYYFAGGNVSYSLRFGKLNLIAVSDEAEFAAWQYGTAVLKRKKPVTREQAVLMFKNLRQGLLWKDEKGVARDGQGRSALD
jgi:hypothetical protein